jgi:hypothetical protein
MYAPSTPSEIVEKGTGLAYKSEEMAIADVSANEASEIHVTADRALELRLNTSIINPTMSDTNSTME